VSHGGFGAMAPAPMMATDFLDNLTLVPVSLQPHLLYSNVGLDCWVMLPDVLMMSQQTRSSKPIARFKTVSCLHPTGSVLEVDHIWSAGIPEYWWRMLWSW